MTVTERLPQNGGPDPMTRRSLFHTAAGLGVGTLVLPGVLSACGGDGGSSATTTAASGGVSTPSGTIDYLGFEGVDYAYSKAMEEWLRSNGMKLESEYWTSFKDGISAYPSGRAEGVDAVHAATCTLPYLLEIGEVLQPLDAEKIPNLSRLLPQFQGTEHPWYVDGELMAIPIGVSPFALMWDAGRVDPAPTSWNDLTAPRFKGRLAVYNDPLVHIWTITEILGLGEQGKIPKDAGPAAAEYLKRMVDNARVLPTSIGDVVQAFTTNDVDACFCGAPIFALLAQQGGAEDVMFDMEPTDGNTLCTEGIGLSSTADNPDAVYAWLNQGLEAKPDADLASLLGGAPTVEGAYEKMDPAVAELFPPGTVERMNEKFPYSVPLPLESDEYLTDAEWLELWTPIAGT